VTTTVRSGSEHAGDQLRVGISLISQGPGQFTGTATYMRELLGEFGRRHRPLSIEVLCNEHPVGLDSQSSHAGISVRRAAGFRVGKTRHSRRAALLVASLAPRRLSRQFSPELDVVHYPLTLMVPAMRLPSVVTVHDMQHRDMPEHFSRGERLWRRHFYESAARRATMVVTDSQHARTRIIESLGIAPDRIVAIHMAVDHDRFRPQVEREEEAIIGALRLPPRYIFYPASLWRHKNHLALLQAVTLTGDDTLHVVLTGARFGRLEEVMSYASAQGLDRRVHHLGNVPDAALPVLYRQAAAVAFPSSYEGFGLPPLEAMACGCPVASSRAASLAEVCGDAAVVLDPDDPQQMSQVLRAVVGDPDLRERLRRKGFDQARRFSWRAAAEAHLAAYRRAAELGVRR
jgi:glycosyltransferase involved in cell wall biosynthesis